MQKIVLALVALLTPGTASACTWLSPFEMDQIAGAELVLVGEVTGYQDLGSAWGAALVTIEVEEALKGKATGEVVLIWNADMAQGPHETRATGRVLIGAMRGGRLAVSDRAPDERPDLPAIMQPYCGEVWIVPATPEAVLSAREALR